MCVLDDANGDAVTDYVVSSSGTFPGIAAYSGADGARLWSYGFVTALSLSPAGDVNGDGASDVWLRHTQALELRSGRDGSWLRALNAPMLHGGEKAQGFHDVSGDQIPDVAVSRFILGPPNRIDIEMRSGTLAQIHWVVSIPGSALADLANVGDCDGDGLDDLAFCGGSSGSLSVLYVLSGRTGGTIRFLLGGATAACGVGDLDGDGRSEIAVGAGLDSHVSTGAISGSVWMYSPARGSVLRRFYPSSIENTGFGFGALQRVGDLDEDGFQDVAVGSKQEASSRGAVRVFSSSSGRELLEILGSPSEELGTSLSLCGDLDRDGRPEWLVGGPVASVARQAQGHVTVMNGRYFGSAEPLGRGCSTALMPEPLLGGSARPIIGRTFELRNLSSAPEVILMGAEAVLPLRVGYSECRFYVELASAAVIGLLPASSAWSFAIPADTRLLGQSLCFQGAVEDSFGSLYGFVLSNGLLVRLGW